MAVSMGKCNGCGKYHITDEEPHHCEDGERYHGDSSEDFDMYALIDDDDGSASHTYEKCTSCGIRHAPQYLAPEHVPERGDDGEDGEQYYIDNVLPEEYKKLVNVAMADLQRGNGVVQKPVYKMNHADDPESITLTILLNTSSKASAPAGADAPTVPKTPFNDDDIANSEEWIILLNASSKASAPVGADAPTVPKAPFNDDNIDDKACITRRNALLVQLRAQPKSYVVTQHIIKRLEIAKHKKRIANSEKKEQKIDTPGPTPLELYACFGKGDDLKIIKRDLDELFSDVMHRKYNYSALDHTLSDYNCAKEILADFKKMSDADQALYKTCFSAVIFANIKYYALDRRKSGVYNSILAGFQLCAFLDIDTTSFKELLSIK